MPGEYTEDQLVQKTTADYLCDVLGWDSVYAYNVEELGPDGTLGRESQQDAVLVRHLRQALVELNPGLPEAAYDDAVQQIVTGSISKSLVQLNQEKYSLFRQGVRVKVRNPDGTFTDRRLRVFDFDEPDKNHFLAVRELWVQGRLYRRRPDIIGFVNGIPLLFIECKNVHHDIKQAYEDNLTDYKDTIPEIFTHNAIVMLSNGHTGRVGSISSRFEHFNDWKRLEEDEPGSVDFETMLKGICSKAGFMDLFENFVVFDDTAGRTVKIVARNHQYLGVNRVIQSVVSRDERGEKGRKQLGVFWHTQGSGKSYSMVFFCQKAHRKLPQNFTFLIVTDRQDLDRQIYRTFAATETGASQEDRAADGDDLPAKLRESRRYVFTLVHKFNKEIEPGGEYSLRDDIIVICGEAHRTQYGRLARNMRDSLPNAAFIAFTGTPLFKEDELTRRIFGDYVSTYPFDRAVQDGSTVPLFYDNRGEKLKIATLDINDRMAEELEKADLDADQEAKLEQALGRDYHIITATKRLERIAQDFVEHYCGRWETGKAMLVCIDKITCGRMWDLINKYWIEYTERFEADIVNAPDEQEEAERHRKLAWLRETQRLIIVSEEQNEVKRFAEWGIDIKPHREKMKKGVTGHDGKMLDAESAFKAPEHPFRVSIVCAMWLTGFDVQSLSTLYLDKPMKGHTLMQAIARANRVYEGKANGLIVDYNGMLKSLRKALATYAGPTGGGTPPEPPVQPADEDLIEELNEAIVLTEEHLKGLGFELTAITESDPSSFVRIKAIEDGVEAVYDNDETKRRFEILAREVFTKFKSALMVDGVNDFIPRHDAISIIYKRLQDNRDDADIVDIMKSLQSIVDDAVDTASHEEDPAADEGKIYDISKVDFERLRKEFERSPRKNTAIQCLKDRVEARLRRMVAQNPTRMDFYKRYQEIVADYNREKDRVTIEKTFDELVAFIESLSEEETRAVREGLDEEYLAMFDLLVKPDLQTRDRDRIKEVARKLLDTLKTEKLRVDNWREKTPTVAGVRTFIYDYLYEHLPEDSYSFDEVESMSKVVFRHVFEQYEDADHHAYTAV